MRLFEILGLIIIGVGLTVLADMFLKKSGASDGKYFILGFLFYGLAALPVAYAFKYTSFGNVFLYWEIIAVMLGMAVASFYYKETFTGYRFTALILALAAIYFTYKS